MRSELRISCDALGGRELERLLAALNARGGEGEGSKCRVALAAVEGVAGDGCGETHDVLAVLGLLPGRAALERHARTCC